MNNNYEAEVSKIENDNRFFVIFFNDDNHTYNMFLGHKIDNLDEDYENEVPEPYGSFSFTKKFKIRIINKFNKVKEIYQGEKIEFSSKVNITNDVFKRLSRTVEASINEKSNSYLKGAIDDLVEFLENYKEESAETALYGLIGEMLLVNKIKVKNRDLAKELFLRYQTNDRKKHDFPLSQNYKIEVKSTLNEDLKFKVKDSQKASLTYDAKLLYAFIKTDKLQKDHPNAKNLYNLILDLKKELEITDNTIPNHIKIKSGFPDWNEVYFDVKNVSLFLVSYEELPNFEEIKRDKGIGDIEYILDMFKFTEAIKYNHELALDEALEFIKEGIKYGK